MRRFSGVIGFMLLLTLSACMRTAIRTESPSTTPSSVSSSSMTTSSSAPALTAEQRNILYEKGTEQPFTSPLLNEHRKGTFVAADTGEPLFRSEAKFDSGTGWPSFYEPISPNAVVLKDDTSWGMTRTEVETNEGSHLGHVFDDGPQPTGKRYCINGLALRFVPDENQE